MILTHCRLLLLSCVFAAGVSFAQSASPTSSPQVTASPRAQASASASPAAAAITATPESRVQAPRGGYVFPNGQTLVYQAQWRVFDAGIATLRMEQAGPEQRVVIAADSMGTIAMVFPVRDRMESFFNPKNFCSLNVSKETEEGLRKVNLTLQFDYTRHKSVLDQNNIKKNEKKHEEHDIPDCVVDVLSGLYYVGAQTLDPGSVFMFPVNDGGKTQNVKITVERREEVKVPAGTFETIRVRPEAEEGPLNKKGKALVWFSDDGRHIPVRMEAKLFWGTLTLKLLRIDQK